MQRVGVPPLPPPAAAASSSSAPAPREAAPARPVLEQLFALFRYLPQPDFFGLILRVVAGSPSPLLARAAGEGWAPFLLGTSTLCSAPPISLCTYVHAQGRLRETRGGGGEEDWTGAKGKKSKPREYHYVPHPFPLVAMSLLAYVANVPHATLAGYSLAACVPVPALLGPPPCADLSFKGPLFNCWTDHYPAIMNATPPADPAHPHYVISEHSPPGTVAYKALLRVSTTPLVLGDEPRTLAGKARGLSQNTFF